MIYIKHNRNSKSLGPHRFVVISINDTLNKCSIWWWGSSFGPEKILMNIIKEDTHGLSACDSWVPLGVHKQFFNVIDSIKSVGQGWSFEDM